MVVGGTILHFVVVLRDLDIDLENSEHIARAIGVALPGIFMAAIAGLVVSLIVHLFSKKCTRSKCFLIFSIFFLVTILMVTYGTSENQNTISNNKANLAFHTVVKIESGLTPNPTINTANKLAKALEVNINDLPR